MTQVETITLYTADGQPVTTVQVPPFSPQAEGILWGNRCFFRRADGRYCEGMLYTVVQTVAEERRRAHAAAQDRSARDQRESEDRLLRAQAEARETATLAEQARPRTSDLLPGPAFPPHGDTIPYFGEPSTTD